MIHSVTLAVSFPVFGNNYYSQPFESRKVLTLMFDEKFEALLIPAAGQSLQQRSGRAQRSVSLSQRCAGRTFAVDRVRRYRPPQSLLSRG